MRSRRSSRRSYQRVGRNLLWIRDRHVLSLSETLNASVVCTADEWESQFTGGNFQRATLQRIVGTVGMTQNGAGTAGTMVMWSVALQSQNATAAVNPDVLADVGENDILHYDMIPAQVTTSSATNPLQRWPLDIKAKRKLTSDSNLNVSALFTADAATPTGFFYWALSVLIARN